MGLVIVMLGEVRQKRIPYDIPYVTAALRAQSAQNPPSMQETWVWSLGREGTLQEEMAAHPSTLAWRIPWTEGPGGLQAMGSQSVRHDWVTNTLFHKER